MKEITLETKIAELLDMRKDMKDILIEINPKFKRLNNPILRRTLAKIATLKQAAIIGGMEPIELLNILREKLGQSPIQIEEKEEIKEELKEPAWINNKIIASFDVNKLLEENKNPLAEVNKKLNKIGKDEIVILKSDFLPEPLIEEFKKKGYKIYSKKIKEDDFLVYIKK